MTNPIYDIPMSEPGGVPGAAVPSAPFASAPPPVASVASPVSGAGQGLPSAAPVAQPAAPETAYFTAAPVAATAVPLAPPVAVSAPVPAMAPPMVATRYDDLDGAAAPVAVFDLDSATAAPVIPAAARETTRREALASDVAAVEIDDDFLARVASLNPGAPIPDAELVSAMQQVVERGASDLHVSSGAAPLLRVDGGLNPIPGTTMWDNEKVKKALYSLLPPAFIERFEQNLELDFAYTLNAASRFRVNFYQDRGAMGAALRIIPTHIKTLKDLGISPEVGHFSTLPRGLVLITGPTGSGKSTTLAALIDLVNETRKDHVVTVEDPIEFMHRNKRSLINQREVGRDTQSFGNALKHVLRQDPDVILIGELRDLETISVALTAAETGHLVFATLHTQSAATTVDRVIDVFPPHQQGQIRTQLAATLQGVVCQTLVKRASGQGRVVATEVMFTTPAVANLVREGKTYQITSVLQSGASQGMHTMDQHLAELVNNGIISKAAALEKAQDSETMERLITRVDMGGGYTGLDAMAGGMR